MRRGIALVAAAFIIVLGSGYGIIPAYAMTMAAEPAPPRPTAPAQSYAVPADTVSAAVARDGYTVTDPPPTLQWPVPIGTRVADGFGPRVAPCAGCSSLHQGIDFDAGSGAPVHAIAAGIVVETNSPGYSALGVHVTIQHLIGGQTVTSVYAHMQTGSMRLRVGDAVTVGQVVGLVGSTGASTGAHLHFEIRAGGTTPVNPLTWLRARLG